MGAILVQNPSRYVGSHKGYKLVMAIKRPPRLRVAAPGERSLCEDTMDKVLTGDDKSFCMSMLPVISSTNKLIGDLERQIEETDNEIDGLLSEVPIRSGSRRGRAPLEIVGKLSKTVFGTALESEVQQFQHTAQTVQNYLSKMANYTNTVRGTSVRFMNATAGKFRSLTKDLQLQATYIQRVASATNATKYTIASVGRAAVQEEWWIKYILTLTAAQSLRAQTLRGYLSHKRDLVRALERLRDGKGSAGLIPFSEMTDSIREAETHINRRGYKIVIRDVGFYYDNLLTSYTFSSTHIYMLVHIPIARIPSYYKVYRLSIFPIPINSRAHLGYSRLRQLPDYLLIDEIAESHSEMSALEMTDCTQGHLLLCPIPRVAKSFTSPSCALGLFLNNRTITGRECKHEVSPGRMMPEMIIPVGNSSALASHGSSGGELSCENNASTLEPCNLCMYRVPCGCILTVGGMSLTSTESYCSVGTLTVSYAVNLPVVDALNISLMHATPAAMYKNPLDIIIPNITTYIERLNRKYGKDYALDLGQYARELNDLQIPQLTDSGEATRLLTNTNVWTMSTITTLTISAAAIIMAGVALYKVNRLLSVIAYSAAARGDRIQLLPAVPTLPVLPLLKLKEPTANIQDMLSAMTYQEKIMTGVLLIILFYVMGKFLKAIVWGGMKFCCTKLCCFSSRIRALCGRHKGAMIPATNILLKIRVGTKFEILNIGTLFDDLGVIEGALVPQVWLAYVDIFCLSSVLCLTSALIIEYRVGKREKQQVIGDRVWTGRPQGARIQTVLKGEGRELEACEVVVILQQGDKRRQLVPEVREAEMIGEQGRDYGMGRHGAGFLTPHRMRNEGARGGRKALYPCPTPSSPDLNPDENARLMGRPFPDNATGNGLTPPPPPKYHFESV